MTLPKPKAIIFDWDNTLVNTWPIIHAALVATFEEMGQQPWSFDQTKNRVRKSMRDSFPEIFGANWQQAGEIYQRHYRKNHLSKLEALPRAEEVLSRVKELGLYSVVVSNKKGPNLRQEVEHIGWNPWFDHVVGADDAKRDKPFVDPVHMAFEKTDIKPAADVWFIGDSEIDLECAHNTGCTAILYGDHALTHPDYSQSHYQGFAYHAHVHDHAQMLRLLDC
ncbi:MAG: HAD family hydrolase [Rickettsiales bacterium]|nr:HAD family hydrolase [Rickettsiales bacterium]